MIPMFRFLLATLFYRLANGLLFLSVAWNLVRTADDGAMSLAISSIAGFLPAVLIAPFAHRVLERVDSRKLTVVGIVGLLLLALAFVPVLRWPTAILVVNFLVLLVFFLLEGAWDTLLATLAGRLPPAQADALNARQSAATQAGLMLGGLPIGILMQLGGSALPFYVAAGLYVVAIVLLAGMSLLVPAPGSAAASAADKTPVAATKTLAAVPWYVLLTLALVWPCLTLINMALPLLAHAFGGAVEHAALLDAMVGLGMGTTGLLYGMFVRLERRSRQLAVVACIAFVPLPFILLATVGYSLWTLAVGFFLSGVGFALFRISVRKQLIATQAAHRVGQIVFRCNAFGFPILVAAALLYAVSWASGPVVPLVAFAAFALAGAKTMIGQHRPSQSARFVTPAPESTAAALNKGHSS